MRTWWGVKRSCVVKRISQLLGSFYWNLVKKSLMADKETDERLPMNSSEEIYWPDRSVFTLVLRAWVNWGLVILMNVFNRALVSVVSVGELAIGCLPTPHTPTVWSIQMTLQKPPHTSLSLPLISSVIFVLFALR